MRSCSQIVLFRSVVVCQAGKVWQHYHQLKASIRHLYRNGFNETMSLKGLDLQAEEGDFIGHWSWKWSWENQP